MLLRWGKLLFTVAVTVTCPLAAQRLCTDGLQKIPLQQRITTVREATDAALEKTGKEVFDRALSTWGIERSEGPESVLGRLAQDGSAGKILRGHIHDKLVARVLPVEEAIAFRGWNEDPGGRLQEWEATTVEPVLGEVTGLDLNWVREELISEHHDRRIKALADQVRERLGRLIPADSAGREMWMNAELHAYSGKLFALPHKRHFENLARQVPITSDISKLADETIVAPDLDDVEFLTQFITHNRLAIEKHLSSGAVEKAKKRRFDAWAKASEESIAGSLSWKEDEFDIFFHKSVAANLDRVLATAHSEAASFLEDIEGVRDVDYWREYVLSELPGMIYANLESAVNEARHAARENTSHLIYKDEISYADRARMEQFRDRLLKKKEQEFYLRFFRLRRHALRFGLDSLAGAVIRSPTEEDFKGEMPSDELPPAQEFTGLQESVKGYLQRKLESKTDLTPKERSALEWLKVGGLESSNFEKTFEEEIKLAKWLYEKAGRRVSPGEAFQLVLGNRKPREILNRHFVGMRVSPEVLGVIKPQIGVVTQKLRESLAVMARQEQDRAIENRDVKRMMLASFATSDLARARAGDYDWAVEAVVEDAVEGGKITSENLQSFFGSPQKHVSMQALYESLFRPLIDQVLPESQSRTIMESNVFDLYRRLPKPGKDQIAFASDGYSQSLMSVGELSPDVRTRVEQALRTNNLADILHVASTSCSQAACGSGSRGFTMSALELANLMSASAGIGRDYEGVMHVGKGHNLSRKQYLALGAAGHFKNEDLRIPLPDAVSSQFKGTAPRENAETNRGEKPSVTKRDVWEGMRLAMRDFWFRVHESHRNSFAFGNPYNSLKYQLLKENEISFTDPLIGKANSSLPDEEISKATKRVMNHTADRLARRWTSYVETAEGLSHRTKPGVIQVAYHIPTGTPGPAGIVVRIPAADLGTSRGQDWFFAVPLGRKQAFMKQVIVRDGIHILENPETITKERPSPEQWIRSFLKLDEAERVETYVMASPGLWFRFWRWLGFYSKAPIEVMQLAEKPVADETKTEPLLIGMPEPPPAPPAPVLDRQEIIRAATGVEYVGGEGRPADDGITFIDGPDGAEGQNGTRFILFMEEEGGNVRIREEVVDD